MRAMLWWRLSRQKGLMLLLLAALLLVAIQLPGLDRLTALLFLAGLAQGALWGTLGLFFALYRRDARRAARGELGMLFLLPAGPTRYALAQAAEYLFWALFLEGGLLGIGALAVGRFYPEAPGELLRLGLYLGFSVLLPFLGLVQLATATDAAYRLGRVGGVIATVVFLGIPFGVGKLFELADAEALMRLGPRFPLGDFGWLLAQLPGLSFTRLPVELPAWPLFAGGLLYLAFLALALRIYHEAEL